MYIYIYNHIHLYLCLSVCLSIYLSVYLSIYLSINLSIYDVCTFRISQLRWWAEFSEAQLGTGGKMLVLVRGKIHENILGR